MGRTILTRIGLFLVLGIVSVASSFAATDSPVDEGWPRELTSKGTTGIVYEPQVDQWDGFNLRAHSAVAVRTTGGGEPVYGVIVFSAQTLVNKTERLVSVEGLQVTDVKFPSNPDLAPGYLPLLQQTAKKRIRYIALDSLEAALASSDQLQTRSLPVRNDVPEIIIAQKPSVLVYIDGEPRYQPVREAKGKLSRLINTRVLLCRDSSGKLFLHLFDGYLTAHSLDGPWQVAASVPREVLNAENAARSAGQIDLMEGQPDPESKQKPSLAKEIPQVFVATRPTELLVIDGAPNLLPLTGTELLYVANTSANIFKDLKDNRTYILISGRWFRSRSLDGPWEYVTHRELPADFAKIPDDSPKENVKASVPDTTQAREALIADSIPQTEKVRRDDSRFVRLDIDGDPQLAPITGTPLSYVLNCSTPVIKVDDQSWYAVENGVWFVATSLDGPWVVADSVPAVIYSIPTSSPLHYVTYVKVYGTTPDYVYVGYTPGYFGTVVSNGVVVYGTGYYYTPWVGSIWIGPPITYGLGCTITWTPWWGWGFGFGFGWGPFGIGWFYPPAPWWGPYWGWGYPGWYGYPVWGPYGWAGTNINIYYRRGPWSAGGGITPRRHPPANRRWSGKYGNAYNSRTGNLISGPRGSLKNVYTPRYAPDRRGNITRGPSGGKAVIGGRGTAVRGGNQLYGTREGRVFRQSGRGTWEHVNPARRGGGGVGLPARDFSREQRARQTGQQRYRSFQTIRPFGGFAAPRSGGGGFKGGNLHQGGFFGTGGGKRGR